MLNTIGVPFELSAAGVLIQVTREVWFLVAADMKSEYGLKQGEGIYAEDER